MITHTRVGSGSGRSEFEVERALSKVSIAAMKATLGQPVVEAEVNSAKLLLDEYSFQKKCLAQTWNIPEKLVPTEEQRKRLEETFTKIPIPTSGIRLPEFPSFEIILPLLIRLVEKRSLDSEEGEALLDALNKTEAAIRHESLKCNGASR